MKSRVQILTSAHEFSQIAAEWNELALASKHPMNMAVWYENAWRCTHSSSDRLHVIALWEDGELQAIAPLCLANGSSRPRYEVIGARILYEPSAMVVRTQHAAEQLAEIVASLKHPVALIRLGAAIGFNDAFVKHAWRAGLTVSPVASGSPFVELTPGWDRYCEGLPSRLKNVIRRGHRQLGKLGQLDFIFLRPKAEQVPSLLQQAFEVELRSWKGRAGSAVLLRDDLRTFFFSYAGDLAHRSELLVSFLRLDGVPVATQIANVSCGAYWQLKIGYDEAYAKQLVGLQLQLETIKWACGQGLDRYEFLGVAEPWIREWTSSVHEYRTMIFYPFNASGLNALLRDNISRLHARLARMRRRS